MITLKKIWAFLKTHWYIPVIIVVGIVMKSKSDSLLKIIDAQKDSYDKQKAAIEEAEQKKQDAKQQIDKEYKTIISSIEKAHARNNQNLEEKKKKQIKKLVKKHYNSPKKMSLEISKALGLNYVANKNNNNTD
jgi:F0F1-type ATP synthase membrane subunit b/b'